MFSEEIKQILLDFAITDGCEPRDIEIYVFPQTWGSTAGGYNGAGGDAMTMSHTIVFYNSNSDNVIFSYGRKKFIRINNPNQKFFEDLCNRRLEPESKIGKYIRDNI